ncbi:DUF4352 domain-containing protein [Mycolicibacterium agri]|uniref:Mpr protein n=2 Tax=Mycolicibacterium agri TaxID=36811 RepID=A0A7I9W3F2_MYCAG|nr:DUF4352 domain-containing protein [Mycolicibacterium agri]GFG52235.1 Mpr protein [Mycolicibacterium agri]
MTTPAGWYPDPDGSGGQRYFDGHAWTDQRAPALQPSSAPSGKVIAGIVAGVVVLLVVGAAAVVMTLRADAGDSTVTRTEASAQSSTVAQDEEAIEAPTLGDQAYDIGTPVRDGGFEFVVTGIERAPAVADPEFPELQKAAEGEYVLVNMTVTNVGTEPQSFFVSYNTLSDGDTEYRADDEAWIYLGNTLADLNPGDSIDTEVVFDVPVGTEPQSIELHGGPRSDGVTVEL